MNNLPPQVTAVGQIQFHGNIHHAAWSQHLRFKNGLVDLVAKEIFADVIYWYRPKEVRNEGGKVVGLRKKFKEDLLQDTYAAIAKRAGLTKRQVQDGMTRLEKDYGVVKKVFRNLTVKRGNAELLLTNVLYIDIIPKRVLEVSNFIEDPEEDSPIEGETEDDVTPITSGRDTPSTAALEVTPPNVNILKTSTETPTQNKKEKKEEIFSHSSERKKVSVPAKLLPTPPPRPSPETSPPSYQGPNPNVGVAAPPLPSARAEGYIPTHPSHHLATETTFKKWDKDSGKEIPIAKSRPPQETNQYEHPSDMLRRDHRILPTDRPASHKLWTPPTDWGPEARSSTAVPKQKI